MNGVFVHPNGLCESQDVGPGTRVWAFAHVLPGARVGRDVNICDHVFIENDVVVGDNVTIKSGVQLWDGLRVEENVFIGPNATFTNDLFPRSKRYPERFIPTYLRHGCSIGANATILAGVTVGAGAMIGAGAVVTRDVPPFAIVTGNPAQITGYVDTERFVAGSNPPEVSSKGEGALPGGARIIELPTVKDLRGVLAFGEIDTHLPFTPERMFMVYGVESRKVRGEHAHRKLEELLICVHGSLRVLVDDGRRRVEVVLDSPHRACYIPPLVWRVHYYYSTDAVLTVLASDKYDADDYIRNYDEFLKIVRDAELSPAD